MKQMILITFFIGVLFSTMMAQTVHPPVNLNATSGTNVIVLNWLSPQIETEEVIQYRVYRNGVGIAGITTALTTQTFTDNDVVPNVVYYDNNNF